MCSILIRALSSLQAHRIPSYVPMPASRLPTSVPCLLYDHHSSRGASTGAWLYRQLDMKVMSEPMVALSLVAHRDNILKGVCAQLGVDENTGKLAEGTTPSRLDVAFEGEGARGDALRREWFELTLAEMFNPDRGLFMSQDGNRTLHPNRNSATLAGPNHLVPTYAFQPRTRIWTLLCVYWTERAGERVG